MGFPDVDVQNDESSVDMIIVSFEPEEADNPHNFNPVLTPTNLHEPA